MAEYLPLGVAALVAVLIWAMVAAEPDGLLHVAFLDVGQGNATLIKAPAGHAVVIDGGPGATALVDALGRSVPFYQHEAALGVLTRASDENLTGLVALLEHYQVGRLLAPASASYTTAGSRWRALIAEQATPLSAPVDGLRVDLGDGVQLEVAEAGTAGEALTLRLHYGHLSIYFEGDAEPAVPSDETATIVRVARHGDSNAARQELLDTLTPSFAVISAAAGRPAAPDAETLARLEEAGAAVYRTDLHGTITFTSDGERVWVATER